MIDSVGTAMFRSIRKRVGKGSWMVLSWLESPAAAARDAVPLSIMNAHEVVNCRTTCKSQASSEHGSIRKADLQSTVPRRGSQCPWVNAVLGGQNVDREELVLALMLLEKPCRALNNFSWHWPAGAVERSIGLKKNLESLGE